MAWWQDALCAIGLATCAPPQPDVSAHTILNLMIQSGGDAEVFPLALGSLYEAVTLLDTGAYALGRDGQVFAQAWCKAALHCSFFYRDDVERLQSFLLQAQVWAEHELGPLERTDAGTASASNQDMMVLMQGKAETVELLLRPAQ